MQAAHEVNVSTGSIPEVAVRLLAVLWRSPLVSEPPSLPPPVAEIPLSEFRIASAKESARFARRLLEQFGEDPARYRVRPGQSRQQP